MSNAVKYMSNNYAGLKFGTLYAFSNSTNFAMNRAYSFGASYNYGPLNVAAGYLQTNGTNSAANTAGAVDTAESTANGTGGCQVGSNRTRIFGGGVGYVFGPAQVGFVYTHSQYAGTNSFGLNNGTMRFDNFDLNAKYALTSAVSLGIADVYTSGHLSGATTFGDDPKFNQVDLQAVYSFSKRTDVYAEAMYQHAIGNNFVAFINTAGGASSTANQVVGTVGIRTRF
jgi:GBP family porin